MFKHVLIIIAILLLPCLIFSQSYKIVDTGQEKFYNNIIQINATSTGSAFYGQDAQFTKNSYSYKDNGDGTITDFVTGLMWTKTPDLNGDGDINASDKLSYAEAMAYVSSVNVGGYDDWRLPTIKEQYSLIVFSGIDPSGWDGSDTDLLTPFIDTEYFDFGYGDESAGERIIDVQFATSTKYVGLTMMGDETMFGVNFTDGRIKGYPTGPMPGQTKEKGFYVLYVRGNPEYGINDFTDNKDGTISDNATQLMWTKEDNGEGLIWEDALSYAYEKNSEKFLGYNDWRLPNVKELQSIVDYSRSLQTTNSPAIDPVFYCSQITDEGNKTNYPFYWSSTTHANMQNGSNAAYVCFGEALGFMQMPPNSGNYDLLDVHGSGAQRSDPKAGNPDYYPHGHGPQGDVIRIYNYVRLVRDIDNTSGINEDSQGIGIEIDPNPASEYININVVVQNFEPLQDIVIYNAMGQSVSHLTPAFFQGGGVIRVDVSDLPIGLYFVYLSGKVIEFVKI